MIIGREPSVSHVRLTDDQGTVVRVNEAGAIWQRLRDAGVFDDDEELLALRMPREGVRVSSSPS